MGLLGAARAAVGTVQNLPRLERVVTDRLGSLDRALREVVAVLPAVADDLRRVRATVEPQHERVARIERGILPLEAVAADLEAVRATVEPQHERVKVIELGLAILPALAADLDAVRATVEPQQERVATIEQTVLRLEARMAELQETLSLLKGDVEQATDALPDPDAPGPLARAREAISGRS